MGCGRDLATFCSSEGWVEVALEAREEVSPSFITEASDAVSETATGRLLCAPPILALDALEPTASCTSTVASAGSTPASASF